MTSSLGSMDFFMLEASEYLERLAVIVATQAGPRPDEFVRFARALRGSALMANQSDFAAAAGGLEALARAYRDGTVEWNSATVETASQAVEELKALLRQAGSWGAEDATRAARLADDLVQVAGRPGPGQRRAAERGEDGLNSGVRAFVAREGALIASSLERAARALDLDPQAQEALHHVLQRMQSLRGLAELTDLTPLPEMLEGLETAAASLTRGLAPPPDVSEVFSLAAEAMTRASRDVANDGRPDPEAAECRTFCQRLVVAFGVEEDVVPIESLAPDGSLSVERRGTPATATVTAVEIVSQGEHLTATGDRLLRAASTLERKLRTFSALHLLRGLEARLGEPLGSAFQAFASAARDALVADTPDQASETLGKTLREAGNTLKEVATRDDRAGIASKVATLGSRITSQAAAVPVDLPGLELPEGPAEGPIVSIADLAPDAEPQAVEPVVPVEELAPDGEAEIAEPVVPISDLAPVAVPSAPAQPAEGGLAATLQTYHRLRSETAPEAPSLERLVTAPLVPPPATPPVADVVVDIDTLLYRGDAARHRARMLGQEISECLDRPGVHMGLRPLLEELIDLLPLADQAAAAH